MCKAKIQTVIAALADVAGVCCGQTPKRVHELARPRKRPPGAPTATDVIMRNLRLRPTSKNDPHDTMRAFEDFHVTRLEWAYIHDEAFVRKVPSSSSRSNRFPGPRGGLPPCPADDILTRKAEIRKDHGT